jgi:uncharacterized protein (TIGR02147 family)
VIDKLQIEGEAMIDQNSETSKNIDYCKILTDELQSRKQRNPSYSLRAFSRDLEVSSARLSRILSGKAAPSRTMSKKIGAKLGYKGETLDWFCALVEARHGKNQEARKASLEFLQRYNHGIGTKKIETKHSFGWNWYHFAIRRLTQLPDFQSDCAWIGNRLGLGLKKTKEAVQELVTAGALAIVDGRIEIRENYDVYFGGDRNKVREKMETDLFARQLPSVLSPSRENSYHARHFFTLNREHFEELRALIKSFESKVDDLTYRAEPPNDLFCLSIDLYSLLNSDPKVNTKIEESNH